VTSEARGAVDNLPGSFSMSPHLAGKPIAATWAYRDTVLKRRPTQTPLHRPPVNALSVRQVSRQDSGACIGVLIAIKQ
jgi:hypothetical protein